MAVIVQANTTALIAGRPGGSLALAPTVAAFAINAGPGSLVAMMTGLAAGETATSVLPNDGRLAIAGGGTMLVVGLTASSPGTISYSVTTSLSRTLTIAVTARTLPVVGNAQVIPFGDSRSAFSTLAPPSATNQVVNGYPNFAVEASGFRAIYAAGGNFGVAGNTLQQMVARLSTITTTPARTAIFLGGVNNGTDDTATVTIPLYQQIFTFLQANFDAFVVCNEYPHTGLTGAQLTQQLARVAYLSNPANFTAYPKAILVDTFHALLDPATACDYKAGYSLDGLHAAIPGNKAVGNVIGATLASLFAAYPRLDRLPTSSSLPFDPATNPTGYLLDNFLLTGTGGSLGGSGLTGVCATDWNINGGSNAGITIAASKGTDSNGNPEVVLTVSGTSPASPTAIIMYLGNNAVAKYMAALASNGKAYSLCRFRVEPGAQGLLGPGVSLTLQGTVGGSYQSIQQYAQLGQAGSPYPDSADDTIMSPLVPVPTGWETGTGRNVIPSLNISMAASSQINFIVHISTFGVLKYS